jgi:6-phospho-beta-glucosidase
MHILESLEQATGRSIDPDRAELKTLGLNHLSWHRGFTIDGEDVWPQVISGFIDRLKKEEHPEWDPRTIEVLRMMPNYYLQYFYHTAKKFKAQESWPPSRAEEVIEVEKDLLREYADPALQEPPADLMKRGGAYYSTVATQLLNAHYNDLGETHVVNTRNNGAVREWPADWVLELPAEVRRSGITPLPAEPLPQACFGLIAQVKSYELLTVQAAVHACTGTGTRRIRLCLLTRSGRKRTKYRRCWTICSTPTGTICPNSGTETRSTGATPKAAPVIHLRHIFL